MARNTPPTLSSYTETTWTSSGSATKVTSSISWNSGDVIVAICGAEGGQDLGTPTATGLTFTQMQTANSGSICYAKSFTAVAASAGSSTVTVTIDNAFAHWGAGIWVFTGTDGVGNSTSQATSAKTVSLAATDAHSAVCWCIFDWSADPTTGISPSPTATDIRQATQVSNRYTYYIADLTDQPSASPTSYGISGGSGTGPFTILPVEVLGTTIAPSSNATTAWLVA